MTDRHLLAGEEQIALHWDKKTDAVAFEVCPVAHQPLPPPPPPRAPPTWQSSRATEALVQTQVCSFSWPLHPLAALARPVVQMTQTRAAIDFCERSNCLSQFFFSRPLHCVCAFVQGSEGCGCPRFEAWDGALGMKLAGVPWGTRCLMQKPPNVGVPTEQAAIVPVLLMNSDGMFSTACLGRFARDAFVLIETRVRSTRPP